MKADCILFESKRTLALQLAVHGLDTDCDRYLEVFLSDCLGVENRSVRLVGIRASLTVSRWQRVPRSHAAGSDLKNR